MSTLRVLLVDADGQESARVVTLLSDANHSVLGTGDLEEAAEALQLQKFDAVLVGSSLSTAAVSKLAASIRGLWQADAGSRIPLLSISPGLPEEQGWSPAKEATFDGYLAEQFGPETLASAIECLSRNVSASPGAYHHSPVFDAGEFSEQCAGEAELMSEIIDLFLIEQESQLTAMHNYLNRGEYDQLSYVAHTLKGSLGSLHAAPARYLAECMEKSAKQKDSPACKDALAALEQGLTVLKPALQTFRRQYLAH